MKIYYSVIFLLINLSCLHNKKEVQISGIDIAVKRDTSIQSKTEEIPNEKQSESQPQKKTKELKSFILNDTIFLLREDYGECGTHSVYIEKNKKSKYYKMLKDFRMHEYGQSTYNSYMCMLRKRIKGGLKTFDLDSLPSQWLPLHYFEGKYYLYAPSDWGCTGKMVIDNYTIINYNMDGPTPCAITRIEKSKNHYRFNYIAPYGEGDQLEESSLIIYIIDPQYKIAIWESKYSEGEVAYKLMLPAQYANHFDIINNYSPLCKTVEIEVGEPDYKSLLTRFHKENNKH